MATVVAVAVVRKHACPGLWSRGELAKFVPLNCGRRAERSHDCAVAMCGERVSSLE
ncbi:hypothetical protein D3C85_1614300 [compost metagenome]